MSTHPAVISAHLPRTTVEQRVIVHNICWTTYERLLADLLTQSAPRLTYDRGTLEIMSPSPEHERYNRIIALFIEILAEELGINIENLGSTTFKRVDLERGFEPSTCFYVQNEARVRGKATIDLTLDPPPDLVIEVDITSGSLHKLPIYAQVGVPEVWRYDGQRVRFYRLASGSYLKTEQSLAFPLLTDIFLTTMLEQSKTLARTALLRAFRAWVREQHTP